MSGFNLLHTLATKKIQHGDVIVFSYPEDIKKECIKRVIGLPNDKVSYSNKSLSVNGKPLAIAVSPAGSNDETLVKEASDQASWSIINTPSLSSKDFEETVTPNSYFVMGDNRDNAMDSRHRGTVPTQNIKVKVIYTTGQQ